MREILFKARRKDNGEWIEGYYQKRYCLSDNEESLIFHVDSYKVWEYAEIIPETLCQFTGLCDRHGNKIWENDVLMCHGNPQELVRAVFGEFGVTDLETENVTDEVIGWHYEVIYTDELSRTEPFCYSMPLTKEYIKRLEMEVVDNPELLQEGYK